MRQIFFGGERVKILQKNCSFVWFFGVFVYAFLHPMNYTTRFSQMKDLLGYIFMVSSTSIAYVVLKLNIFKVSCIDSASIKWPLFGIFWLLIPQLLFDLDEIEIWNFFKNLRQSNKTNTSFEKSFNILKFGSNVTHWKFTVLVHFATQSTAGKPKLCLKPKVLPTPGHIKITEFL